MGPKGLERVLSPFIRPPRRGHLDDHPLHSFGLFGGHWLPPLRLLPGADNSEHLHQGRGAWERQQDQRHPRRLGKYLSIYPVMGFFNIMLIVGGLTGVSGVYG